MLITGMLKGKPLPIPDPVIEWVGFHINKNVYHFDEPIIIEGQLKTTQDNHVDIKIWQMPTAAGGPKPPHPPPSKKLVDYLDINLYDDNGIVRFHTSYKLDNKHTLGNYEIEGSYALAPAPQNPLKFQLVP